MVVIYVCWVRMVSVDLGLNLVYENGCVIIEVFGFIVGLDVIWGWYLLIICDVGLLDEVCILFEFDYVMIGIGFYICCDLQFVVWFEDVGKVILC